MIGKLTGVIDHRGADHVLLDVRGVGYVVHVSERTLAALPGPGEAAVLYTELLVREDLMQLFGFLSPLEREWHRTLTTVQGVGAKAALSILGALGAEGLARAISLGDSAAIRAAPGVGPKLAQRVALELKDKAAQVMALGAHGPGSFAPAPPASSPAPAGTPRRRAAAAPDTAAQTAARAQAEALSALTNLGYSPTEAAQAVAQAAEVETETPALIRAALRLLAPKG